MRYPLLIFVVWIFCAGTTEAGQDFVRLAALDVTVWSQRTEAKQPVIIFSHGFHGCATQSRFLMEAFAADGYLVFAPNHRDATCNGGKGSWLSRAEIPFRDPGTWNESTYRDRADDIHHLVGAIGTDNRSRWALPGWLYSSWFSRRVAKLETPRRQGGACPFSLHPTVCRTRHSCCFVSAGDVSGRHAGCGYYPDAAKSLGRL